MIVHMRKWRRMTPASIALCIPSPHSMVEGASAAPTPQVRTMGVLLPARGLARWRICIHNVRRMMLVEYIQNSPARSLILGSFRQNDHSSGTMLTRAPTLSPVPHTVPSSVSLCVR